MIKGSPDQNHFIFEINVGKKTDPRFNDSEFESSGNASYIFRVLLCRIRLYPTLISKIKWFWSGLPLNIFSFLNTKMSENGTESKNFHDINIQNVRKKFRISLNKLQRWALYFY